MKTWSTRSAIRDVIFNPIHIFLSIFTGVWFFLMLLLAFMRICDEYTIKGDVLILDTGFFFLSKKRVDLINIRSIEVERSGISSSFNVGNVLLNTSGETYKIKKVHNPDNVAEIIEEARKEARKNLGVTISA